MCPTSDTSGAGPFLRLDDAALLAQCELDTYRAHGPGGQKRNKTSSAVRLRHQPTGLIVTATEERSQHINKARALKRMREAIALHVRGVCDAECLDIPTVAKYRSPDGGLRVSTGNDDFPFVVAELLDVFHKHRTRVSDAAMALALTTGQLIRFFESHPKLWERVNQMRAEAGEKPLR